MRSRRAALYRRIGIDTIPNAMRPRHVLAPLLVAMRYRIARPAPMWSVLRRFGRFSLDGSVVQPFLQAFAQPLVDAFGGGVDLLVVVDQASLAESVSISH